MESVKKWFLAATNGKSVRNDNTDLETVPIVSSGRSLRNTHLASFAALLNVVAVGIVSAYSAPATVDMRKPGSRLSDITSSQVTWIASLPAITSVVGSPLSGYLSHKLGRKTVLMLVSGPFLASWLMIAYAPSVAWIYAGRLVSGFCVGITCVTVPAYIVEIATTEVRGLLASCFQLSFTVGVLIAMSLGIILRWSFLAVAGGFIVTCSVLLMYFMPESPSWLIVKGRDEEAVKAIQFLKGEGVDTLKEYHQIVEDMDNFKQRGMSLQEFGKPQLYKPLLLVIGLMFFQQFSGINALMSYTVEIFEHAESSLEPEYSAAIVAGVQVLATMVANSLIEKAGRKVLYVVSGCFITLGLLILSVYGIVAKNYDLDTTRLGWVPLIGFIVFIASFSLGYGPIPFAMTPELVPVHSRSTVLAVGSIFNSFFMFVVTKTFDDMRTFLSDYGTYCFYGFCSFLGCLFCIFCLPETKGKSINEIQKFFTDDDQTNHSVQ